MSSKRQLEAEISDEVKKIRRENSTDITESKETDETQDAFVDDDECLDSKTERCMIHIGDDMYVVAKHYNDELFIHIRQYNKYGDQLYPTKKGVVFSLSRWLMLESYETKLTQFFENFDSKEKSTDSEEEEYIHLGGGIYISLNCKYPVLNMRHWWKPDSNAKPCPTKRGVMLNRFKWNQVKDVITVIRDFVPELNESPIGCGDDHQNQLGMLRCKECNPFGSELY